MIRAYPIEGLLKDLVPSNDKWVLRGDKSSDTYNCKDKIAEAGGKWDGKNWIVSEGALINKEFPYVLMKSVIIEPYCCYKEEQRVWATLSEWQRGTIKMGCSMCDTVTSCGPYVNIKQAEIKRGMWGCKCLSLRCDECLMDYWGE